MKDELCVIGTAMEVNVQEMMPIMEHALFKRKLIVRSRGREKHRDKDEANKAKIKGSPPTTVVRCETSLQRES